MNIQQIGVCTSLMFAITLTILNPDAYALSLDKSTKVSVSIGNNLSVDLYAKYVKQNSNGTAGERQRKSLDYYYAPSRVRVSAGANNEPQITILTYISDGAEGASGGTFNSMVTWDLTESEKRKVALQLKRKVPGAKLRGAVPLETSDSGQSISVLVALGGEEKVAWSGRAPTQSGGRAAIAANLSPIGANLLDVGIRDGNLAGISVSMDYMIPFKVDLGTCNVSINWDTLKTSYNSRTYTQQVETKGDWFWRRNVSNQVRDHGIMIDYGQQSGAIVNDCDYGRVTSEQQEFFEKAIESFVSSKLAATEKAQKAMAEANQDADNEEEDDTRGANPNPSTNDYDYSYSEFLLQSFSGTDTYKISRAVEVLEPFGPIVGNVKEWVAGYENSNGVRISSVNLTTSEFSQVPVSFTLGANAIDMFGLTEGVQAQLNSVVVTLKKRRENGGDFSRSHTFTRKSVANGEIDKIFEYARGTNTTPLDYEYSTTFNYVGKRAKEAPYVRSDSGSHTLEPNAKKAPVIFATDSSQLSDNQIMGATAEVRHRFLGKDRTSYINLIAGGEPSAKAILFVDLDTPNIAVRTIFTHQKHGQLATDWKPHSVPNSGGVMVFGVVPEKLIDDEPGFIDRAKQSVNIAAERKLDDVLEEFGKL